MWYVADLAGQLHRLEKDYALLLQANHKLGFRIQDETVERVELRRRNAALIVQRDEAFERLNAFAKVCDDAAYALQGGPK